MLIKSEPTGTLFPVFYSTFLCRKWLLHVCMLLATFELCREPMTGWRRIREYCDSESSCRDYGGGRLGEFVSA